MNSIESLLGMIRYEALMYSGMTEEQWREEGYPMPYEYRAHKYDQDLPPIDFPLELVKSSDGKFYWVE